MDPDMRKALDELYEADKAHTAALENLNAKLVALVNLAATKAKPEGFTG